MRYEIHSLSIKCLSKLQFPTYFQISISYTCFHQLTCTLSVTQFTPGSVSYCLSVIHISFPSVVQKVTSNNRNINQTCVLKAVPEHWAATEWRTHSKDNCCLTGVLGSCCFSFCNITSTSHWQQSHKKQ